MKTKSPLGYFFLFIFSLWGSSIRSQDLHKADSLAGIGYYELAAEIYKAHVKKFPDDLKVRISLGNMYHLSYQFKEAVVELRKAAETDKCPFAVYKNLGADLIRTGEYEEARVWFDRYADYDPFDPEIQKLQPLIDTLGMLIGVRDIYDVSLLSINSPEDDYAPAWYKTGIIFTSKRPSPTTPGEDNGHGDCSTNIYVADGTIRGKNPAFFKPTLIRGLGPSYYCSSNASYDKNTGTVSYLRRNGMDVDTVDRTLHFFIGEITSPPPLIKPLLEPFPSDYPPSSACFFPTGDSMMISYPKARGNSYSFDLGLTKKNTAGDWDFISTPILDSVNTQFAEFNPFINENHRLYFCSDRAIKSDTTTPYDIFTAEYNGVNGWKTVRPLPFPINTNYNETGFIITPDGNQGIFASDRPGGNGGFDLYYFIRATIKVEQFTTKPVNLCGTLIPEDPPAGSNPEFLIYSWHFADGSTVTGKNPKHCFPHPGANRVVLKMTDSRTKRVVGEGVRTYNFPSPTQAVIQSADSASVGKEILFNGEASYLNNFDIAGHKWDFGDGTYASGEKVKHVFHKPGTYTVRLTVAGINANLERVERIMAEKQIVIQ